MKKSTKKKTALAKKRSKKTSAHRITKTKPPVKGVMAIIPYSEIQKPEVYKGKFTLIPTPFNELQIKAIIAPTPKQIIKTRPGKGGGTWDYVPGWWFKKKLNFVFGFAHSFEILGERVDGDFVTVKGRLTVRNTKGQEIAHKDDFGGAAIKYLKGTKNYLDLPNDFKAAATDALKRCAVQFGFAMDIYGKGEAHDEGYEVVGNGNGDPQQPKQATVVEQPKASEKDIEYQNLIKYAADNGAVAGKEKMFIEARLGRKINWVKLDKKELIMIKVQLMSRFVRR